MEEEVRSVTSARTLRVKLRATRATVSPGEKEEGILGWSRSYYRTVLVQLYLQTRLLHECGLSEFLMML